MNNGSRVTGSLSTVLEKYKNLAKDATSSGDYVGAENYMQHAEHYSRMINERNARNNNHSNVASNGPLANESESKKKSAASEVSEDDTINEDSEVPVNSKKTKDLKDKKSLN